MHGSGFLFDERGAFQGSPAPLASIQHTDFAHHSSSSSSNASSGTKSQTHHQTGPVERIKRALRTKNQHISSKIVDTTHRFTSMISSKLLPRSSTNSPTPDYLPIQRGLLFTLRDPIVPKHIQRLLDWSYYCSLIGGIFAGIGILYPSLHNYLHVTALGSLFPPCAPEFDLLIESTVKHMFGLAIIYFLITSLALLFLSAPFAVIRVGIFLAEPSTTRPELSPMFQHIVFLGGFLTIPLLIMPAILFRHWFNASEVTLLLSLFLVTPVVVLWASLYIFKSLGVSFLLWRIAYYGLLIALVVKIWSFQTLVRNVFTPRFFFLFMADVGLTDVVIGDIFTISLQYFAPDFAPLDPLDL